MIHWDQRRWADVPCPHCFATNMILFGPAMVIVKMFRCPNCLNWAQASYDEQSDRVLDAVSYESVGERVMRRVIKWDGFRYAHSFKFVET